MSSPAGTQQTALNCYLSTIVALADCLGPVYRDRLLRVPRRLGFDPTPEALEESWKTLEADLTEFARAFSERFTAESNHAHQVLEYVASAADGIRQSGELHAAMLNDLAEHMETSAEVDEAPQVRASLTRYAAGLRAYAKKKKIEDQSVLAELRRRARELEGWLSSANRSDALDPVTGLLGQAQALRQLQTHLDAGEPFCVLWVRWAEAGSIPPQLGRVGADQMIRQIGEHLTALVRPRDIAYHWGQGRFSVIFEVAAEQAQARAASIAQWLSTSYSAVIDGTTWKTKANVTVTVIDPMPGEALSDFVQRIDATPPQKHNFEPQMNADERE